MHAVWLRTREGTRRLVAEEHRDGQYQEAAAQEERAVDAVASATEAAVGTALRSGKKLAQQVARKHQVTVQPSRLKMLHPGEVQQRQEQTIRLLI